MNISVTLPNTIPLALQPPTDNMRRDNVQRESIVQTPEMVAYPKENEIGGEKDRNKARVVAQQYQGQNQGNSSQNIHERVTERDAQQHASHQDQSPQEQPNQQDNPQSELSTSLTDSEQHDLDDLRERDAEVRQHERQHQAVGGHYTQVANYKYQRGADGSQYAISGEVSIDVAPIAGDPKATIEKMQQVQRAALAPSQPSVMDQQVTVSARREESTAQAVLRGSDSREVISSPLNDVMTLRNEAIHHRYKGSSELRNRSNLAITV